MIAPNTKFGPYEVVALVGSGGMGEVYRARDPRLGRDVALKVLPSSYTADADRLRRFEQEARSAAALNHPNILAIFDIGTQQQMPFIVSELLEGETLRDRLRTGALSVRRSIEIAVQVAGGLAAAHEKGIIHRDLKPENIFLTHDGRVKILDFGLAKLTQRDSAPEQALTAEGVTDPGTVLGTMGYMSPEQVRGQAADPRSDIFSFGAILYEMLTGKRAFHGATSADTISAILKEDPPDLVETNRSISPALERIVRHCLEKAPSQRFHSARDIAFDLEALSLSSGSTVQARAAAPYRPGLRKLALISAGVVLLALAFIAGRGFAPARVGGVPEIQQLTFRRGWVSTAAFAPDGRTVVYSASWEGNPEELFTTSAQSPESRSLEMKDAEVLAISSSGEMAVKLHMQLTGNFSRAGTLASVPLTGGAPRELLDNVEYADWSPDGSQLAVIQDISSGFSLQYPVGKTLFASPTWISHARISPGGKSVAFLNHPFGGDEGSVMLAGPNGVRELSNGFLTVQGLAWTPDGKEIWFTGTRAGANRALYAVTPAGQERLIMRVPGMLTVQAINNSGSVLMTQADDRFVVMALVPGWSAERDLSWFDAGIPTALSPDDKQLLIAEVGEGGGASYTAYLRPTDGSPAVRMGDGNSCALSPDGKVVLDRSLGNPSKLFLLPTLGAPQELATGAIDPGCGAFLPDGRVVFVGRENGHQQRLYLLDPKGGPPRPISAEGAFVPYGLLASADGQSVIAISASGSTMRYPIAGGAPQSIQGLLPAEAIVGGSSDGRTFYVVQIGKLPAQVFALDALTGQRKLWRELRPSDMGGVVRLTTALVAHDGKAYAYSYERTLSELYLFNGLR